MVETIANATITNIRSPLARLIRCWALTLVCPVLWTLPFDYFFFSAFHTVREIARPQNGQKLIRYRLGRSSGERTA